MTNSAIEVFDRTLALVDGGQGTSMALSKFVLTDQVATDPRVVYDQATGRFYYSALAEGSGQADLFFGYSKVGQARDLSNGWCRLPFPSYYGPPPASPNPGYTMDYDSLGGNGGAIWIGLNVFIGQYLSSATIVGVRKPYLDDCENPYGPDAGPLQLGHMVSTPGNYSDFYAPALLDGGTPAGDGLSYPWLLPNGNGLMFDPQPANNIAPVSDSASSTYILSMGNPDHLNGANEIFASRVGILLNGTMAPFEDWASLPVAPFVRGPNYLTPDGGMGLRSIDARLTGAVAAFDPSIGPSAIGVWTQHTIARVAGERARVRWYEVKIDPQNGGVYDAGIYQWGEVASADGGEDYYAGSVSPSIAGNDAVMTYNRSSDVLAPTIEMRSRQASTPLGQFEAPRLVATSSQSLSCPNNPCRWGDYSMVAADPSVPGYLCGTNEVLSGPFPNGVYWSTVNFCAKTDLSDLRIVKTGGDGQTATVNTTFPTPLQVQIQDPATGQPVPGVRVTFAPFAGGSVGANKVLTDSNGTASTMATASTLAGPSAYTASVSGTVFAGFTETGTPDVVQKVAFGSAIAGQVAGQTILPAVTVNIEDQFGNIVTNSSSQVTIGLGANPSAATLFGTLTVSAVNGVATFTDLAISLAGVGYTFNASSGAFGVASPAFNVFAANLGGSALSILAGNSQSAPVTQSLAVPLSVRVLDAGSNPVPGATITWASLTSGGAVQATTSVANAMGIAQMVASLGTSTGQYSVSATTYSGASVFFSMTATGGPAVSISFLSVPSQVTSGSPMSPSPQVSALDQYGNQTTSTCTIFLSISSSSPSGATLNGWYPGQALGGSSLIIMAAQAGAYALKATCSTMTATSSTFQLSLATDPKGAFVAAGQFVTPRFDHTATLLQDGRVLLAGGYDGNGVALKSAEIYDPVANSFQATGSLSYERANHTATLMQDGTVLFVGGTLSTDPNGTYELYNPSSGQFQNAGFDPNGLLGRTGHTATLLWDGTVLITGGGDRRSFQSGTNLVARYRPGGGFYTDTMNSNRYGHTAALLPNDVVLIFGGEQPDNGTAETYDRHGNVGNLYYFNYTQHPAFAHGSIGESALLPSGNVFGWRDNILYETATGLFDTLYFNPPAPYVVSRNVLLPFGKMLVTGDSGTGSFLLDPMNGNSTSSTDNPGFLTSVISSATLLTDGSVFYAGGLLSSGVGNSAGSRFIPATPPISNLRLDFGLTAIGSSPTAVATFHNSSSAAVIVTSIAAPSGWFTASGLPTLPLTLGAGQSVSINVAFAPQYSEVEFNQLALLYAGGSATATVTGTGAQPAQLWCSDPTDFGNVGLERRTG